MDELEQRLRLVIRSRLRSLQAELNEALAGLRNNFV